MANLEIGSLFLERYRIERALGAGGVGEVVLAQDLQLSRKVAIKVLHTWSAQSVNDVALRRFEREAQTMSRLVHQNIVQVFRFGVLDDGSPFLVMEFAEGESLREFLQRRGALACNEAVAVALQICSAMEFAHSIGIIHRDLKPDNVMLLEAQESTGSDPRRFGAIAKVLDFGLSKTSKSEEARKNTLTDTGLIVGTVLYMSPEQGLGEDVDQRSDIYSFACLFFEMITGRVPFLAETPAAVLLKHLSEPMPGLRASGSKDKSTMLLLEKVISKAGSKNKLDRYASFTDLKSDLAEISALNSNAKFAGKLAGSKAAAGLKVIALSSVLLVLVLVAGSIALAFTPDGKLILAGQIQNSLDASKASRMLLDMHKHIIAAGDLQTAEKLVQVSTSSRMFQIWPSPQRARFMADLIINYESAGRKNEAFKMTITFLEKVFESIRSEQKNQSTMPPDGETTVLQNVCRRLYSEKHSRNEWGQISSVLELNGAAFLKKSYPAYLLWPSALRVRARSKVADLNLESNVEHLSHLYVQPISIAESLGQEALMLELANEGTLLAHKYEMLNDERQERTSVCEYYLARGLKARAIEELAKVEAVCKNLLLSNADTERLNKLRAGCGIGEIVPVPENKHDGPGMFEMLMQGDEKKKREYWEEKLDLPHKGQF